VYSGPWKECRKDDLRHFVMVEPPNPDYSYTPFARAIAPNQEDGHL
jgi:hypothetical protein